MADDFDPMVMSTFETLEMPVRDEYDRDEMEHLDEMDTEGESNVPEPRLVWDIPGFTDVSAWDANEPDDEYLGRRQTNYGKIGVGATFSTKADAIYAVQRYSILNHVEYFTRESDSHLLILHCRMWESTCPWRIRIMKKKNRRHWEVTKYRGDHICNTGFITKENVHLTRHFIAMEIGDVISERLRFSPGDIKERIFKDYRLEIRYLKAWQARRQALLNIFGDWDDSFRKLMVINRVFWAFGPAIAAFTHCRPVLYIDGTHLYEKYNGKLLVAVSLDANNHILPLAFAVVESENNSSWKWFMKCIREGVTSREGLCVISDRHKGIMHAMQELEWIAPHAHHRVCIRHLQSNFNIKMKNAALKKKMGHIAHQRQKRKFASEYKELKYILHDRPEIVNWLDNIPWSMWSLAYDNEGRRWGSMTTNASECFNNSLKGARDLPICALVLFTFMQYNTYFCKRHDTYQTCVGMFPPKIDLKMREIREKADYHRVQVFDGVRGVYQVTTARRRNIHEVKLSDGTCTCGKWEAFHYPCSHVMSVCKSEGLQYTQFVDYHYTLDAYFQTWGYTFNVIPDERRWRPFEGPEHIPNPAFKSGSVGRNPSRRRHNEMDQGASSSQRVTHAPRKCSVCHLTGHNKRSCPNRANP